MVFPHTFWILFIVCACLCAIGFYKFVYFLSVGYGFAIAGAGVVMLLGYHDRCSAILMIQCLLFVCYGMRLGLFLIVREWKSLSYRNTLKEVTKQDKKITIGIQICIWLSVSLLYVLQISPLLYRFSNGKTVDVTSYVAVGILFVALIIETIADFQKNKSKKENPNQFCSQGLYKFVRCPNYFGELLFWTGVFVSGVTAFVSFGQLLLSLVGYIAIIYIMLSGAKRLEIRQDKNYGGQSAYQRYNRTPILLPVIHWYSLKRCKWLKV